MFISQGLKEIRGATSTSRSRIVLFEVDWLSKDYHQTLVLLYEGHDPWYGSPGLLDHRLII